MFNLDSINKIMGGGMPRVTIEKDILDFTPPGGGSVVKVHNAFNSPMTTTEICKASGCSVPTVLLVMRFMRHYGDATTNGKVSTPTGNSKLLNEYQAKVIPSSNTGVTGVSWVESTKTFHCCFGRKISFYSNNLFDAVCMRKSLELSSI